MSSQLFSQKDGKPEWEKSPATIERERRERDKRRKETAASRRESLEDHEKEDFDRDQKDKDLHINVRREKRDSLLSEKRAQLSRRNSRAERRNSAVSRRGSAIGGDGKGGHEGIDKLSNIPETISLASGKLKQDELTLSAEQARAEADKELMDFGGGYAKKLDDLEKLSAKTPLQIDEVDFGSPPHSPEALKREEERKKKELEDQQQLEEEFEKEAKEEALLLKDQIRKAELASQASDYAAKMAEERAKAEKESLAKSEEDQARDEQMKYEARLRSLNNVSYEAELEELRGRREKGEDLDELQLERILFLQSLVDKKEEAKRLKELRDKAHGESFDEAYSKMTSLEACEKMAAVRLTNMTVEMRLKYERMSDQEREDWLKNSANTEGGYDSDTGRSPEAIAYEKARHEENLRKCKKRFFWDPLFKT